MECPIHDANGEPRSLASIEFTDFAQLEEYDEGYTVEYKSALDESVKKKLPKIVASFSNASGGWIFIGIGDKAPHTVECVKSSRTDYGQIIGGIIRRRLSPLPRFDVRFVADPDDGEHGVIVIEVSEGPEPPYIANGSVYVRVASSSEEFMEKADSYVLIELQRKARNTMSDIDDFCHRSVYVPPVHVYDGVPSYDLPVYDVYLKRLSAPREPIPYQRIDEISSKMCEIFQEGFGDRCVCQRAHSSLLFHKPLYNSVDGTSPILELFYDGSIKLCLPMNLLQANEREMHLKRLSGIQPINNKVLVQLLDGKSCLVKVLLGCQVIDGYFGYVGRDVYDYAYAVEFENMQGCMIDFDNMHFDEYVIENGIPFIGTLDERTKPRILHRHSEEEPCSLSELAVISFQEALGLPFATADENARDRTLLIEYGDLYKPSHIKGEFRSQENPKHDI